LKEITVLTVLFVLARVLAEVLSSLAGGRPGEFIKTEKSLLPVKKEPL
jgi:hypothetical protein